MSKAKAARIAGFTVALGATASLVGFAATSTGAYFTDAKTGTVSGTMGSIKITGTDGAGANNTDISFANMLPGEQQSKTVGYTNSGANPEDVWVVFPQSALGDFNHSTDTGLVNDLGHYGEIHVDSNGTEIFGSTNLNDDPVSCPPAGTDCNPLPHMLKLADNVAPGTSGNWTFAFTPGAKFKGNAGLPVLNLPYTLVATQHGIAPDNALNSTVVS